MTHHSRNHNYLALASVKKNISSVKSISTARSKMLADLRELTLRPASFADRTSRSRFLVSFTTHVYMRNECIFHSFVSVIARSRPDRRMSTDPRLWRIHQAKAPRRRDLKAWGVVVGGGMVFAGMLENPDRVFVFSTFGCVCFLFDGLMCGVV